MDKNMNPERPKATDMAITDVGASAAVSHRVIAPPNVMPATDWRT
jgi:hypothetical protein